MRLSLKGIIIATSGLLITGIGILIGMINNVEVIPALIVEFTWIGIFLIVGTLLLIVGIFLILIGTLSELCLEKHLD